MIDDYHYKAALERNKALRSVLDECELAEASMDREPEDNGYSLADAITGAFDGASGALEELDARRGMAGARANSPTGDIVGWSGC